MEARKAAAATAHTSPKSHEGNASCAHASLAVDIPASTHVGARSAHADWQAPYEDEEAAMAAGIA
eukprot:4612077-Pleurochrysis_carterae.AAC.1